MLAFDRCWLLERVFRRVGDGDGTYIPQKDPRTTSQASRPPSGYVTSSSSSLVSKAASCSSFVSARIAFGGVGAISILSLADGDMLTDRLDDGDVVPLRAGFISSIRVHLAVTLQPPIHRATFDQISPSIARSFAKTIRHHEKCMH
jgi:hypothetical protein